MDNECRRDSSFDSETGGASKLQGNIREVRTMRTNLIITLTVLVAALVLIMGIPSLPTQAAEKASGASIASASAGEIGVVASGAAEDTLLACLARIPKDASAGQRMFAEQSCKRDEGTRELVNAVPGR